MKLLELQSITEEFFIRASFGSALISDWHPCLTRAQPHYQTSICDRISFLTKVSPATVARDLKAYLEQRGIACDSDARGYLYADASQVQDWGDCAAVPSALRIELQPPRVQEFSLHDLKLISLLGIQLLLLQRYTCEAVIVIRSESGPKSDSAVSYANKAGFLRLLEHVLDGAHEPNAQDFYEPIPSLAKANVCWLNIPVLSLVSAGTLIEAQQREAREHCEYVIRSCHVRETDLILPYRDLIVAVEKGGCPQLIQFALLESAADLDMNVLQLENGLNLCWLLQTALARLGQSDSKSNSTIAKAGPGERQMLTRLLFLVQNLPLFEYRAAFRGAANSYLLALKEAASLIHRMLNSGSHFGPRQGNILASFPGKMSSIIEGF